MCPESHDENAGQSLKWSRCSKAPPGPCFWFSVDESLDGKVGFSSLDIEPRQRWQF